MQIHEITLRRQLDEGILDNAKAVVGKVGAGIQGAKTGYKSSQISRQTADVAKKAWGTWQVYADQLQKQYAGNPKFPQIYREQLLAFVQKNLLRGAHLPNLINKDEIIGLVDQLTKTRTGTDVAASTAGAGKPPADTTQKTAPADAAQIAATSAKIEAGKEVALGNEHYRWLGAQWALVNPKTGQPGKTAEKAIAPELTKMAQAGKFVQPFTSPDAGALSTAQMAANAAAAKKDGPYGFDTKTGKPLPPPGKGVKGTYGRTPGGVQANPGQMPADVANSPQGKKMRLAYGEPKGGIQGMPSDLEEASLPDAIKGNVQQWKDTFKSSTPATAAKPAPSNAAQEKQLFDKLVNASVLSANKVATGQSSPGTSPSGTTDGTGEDPYQLVTNVQQQEKAEAGVDSATLKKVGNVIRNNYTSGNPSIRKTGEPGVDALLLAMGFQV